MVYGGLLVVLALLLIGAWSLFGPGPRRGRAFQRVQRLLQQGKWQEALALIKTLQGGGLSATWQGRLRSAEGECHHKAAESCLRAKDYEESLRHFQTAAGLLNADAGELRTRVVESMLAEVRQQFAACKSAVDNQAVQELIARVLRMESPCPEATFWRGLCDVREGNLDAAMAALHESHEQGGKRVLDPPLYLGTLRIRTGQTQEGLRLLGEANRVDTGCPLVSLELGVGMVAANGDGNMAVRALQRALGPRGLAPWLKQPEKLWSETFPEARSYVQRLARKHAFVCPVFGNDVAALARHGEFALAQAEYRQGDFPHAADRFAKLLQDAPPSAPLLRGLGLSLARLDRYDQAYKHLRAALDMEEPKDPLTAGYLALCGAMGKPIRDEDKARNVEWSISLLGRFSLPGNAEWARINSAVFAEARKLGLPIAVEDQVRLCESLRSVDAADSEAAAAYAQLAATSRDAIRPEYAWLYCRAAHVHGFTSEQDLELFGRTFRDEESARAFYDRCQWDLAEVAYTYLARCAVQRPGHFPEEFGPDYPERGEKALLARAEQLEADGKPHAALAAVDDLLKLAPGSIRAHDRLAQLHYRRGDLDRAAELLAAWEQLAPDDVQPAVQRAIVEQQHGNAAGRDEAVRRALELARGKTRAAVAYLGAKLLLAAKDDHRKAEELLVICLRDWPDHVEALSCLAMVRCVAGDLPGLAALARQMDRPDVPEPRFHYLAAVCHLAAEDSARAIAAARRAADSADAAFAVECEYLLGWAHLHQGKETVAVASFEKVAEAAGSPSADLARAAAAWLRFRRDDYDEAAGWWKTIEPSRRAEWQLDEPLRQTVFLSALAAHAAGEHAEAADRLREAGQLGLRDGRLGPLLTTSLVQAAQGLLYQEEEGPAIYRVLEA